MTQIDAVPRPRRTTPLRIEAAIVGFATLWSWALAIGGRSFIALSKASESREPIVSSAPAGVLA
jgi:hypothetical protein